MELHASKSMIYTLRRNVMHKYLCKRDKLCVCLMLTNMNVIIVLNILQFIGKLTTFWSFAVCYIHFNFKNPNKTSYHLLNIGKNIYKVYHFSELPVVRELGSTCLCGQNCSPIYWNMRCRFFTITCLFII